MALFSFSEVSPASGATQNYPTLTPVSTQAQADAFKARYASWTSGGGTNWDRGLAVAAAQAAGYDVVVVITDGNPTRYNDPPEGPSSSGRLREMENAIFSANEVKHAGARVLAFGVGSGATSPVDGAEPRGDLRAHRLQRIERRHRRLLPDRRLHQRPGRRCAIWRWGTAPERSPWSSRSCRSTRRLDQRQGRSPREDGHSAERPPQASTVTPGSGVTAAGTGAVNFNLNFPGGTTTTNFTATETQQSGYTLQQVSRQECGVYEPGDATTRRGGDEHDD